MIKYILYNPEAGAGAAAAEAESLAEKYAAKLIDTYEIEDYAAFFAELSDTDELFLVGGDGTLNYFANAVCGIDIANKIYYHPFGTGNDFARDVGCVAGDTERSEISKYLRELPRVTINGVSRVFVNNVGFGIDGYCTERGDFLREKYAARGRKKRVNYTAVAIGGLLFGYKVRDAVVTVDGAEYKYRRVWIASSTKGRYFGGGMMASPTQDRLEEAGRVSLLAFHGLGKLHALVLFPSIFTGGHVKHEKYIKIHKGHRITVKFDRPTPLQIDGETVSGVTEYTVETGVGERMQERTAVQNV